MLVANEVVARELNKNSYPALYRIHEEPDAEKMDETLAYLGKLKIGGPKGGSVTPKDLQQRDWFRHYTEQTKLVAGGEVEVLPLEIIAETSQPA